MHGMGREEMRDPQIAAVARRAHQRTPSASLIGMCKSERDAILADMLRRCLG
jgi:hypothetical protein